MGVFDLFEKKATVPLGEEDNEKKENECTVTRNENSVVMFKEGVRLFLGDVRKTVTLSDGQKVIFSYDAVDPEGDLKLWHRLVREAESDRFKKYKNDSFPPDTW